jgi:hypothetical protein
MHDWNVVITVHEHGSRQALGFLRRFGTVVGTDYYNVLTLRVADPGVFPAQLQDAFAAPPEQRPLLARASSSGATTREASLLWSTPRQRATASRS